MVEDYRSVGLTLGRHPVAFLREELRRRGMIECAELLRAQDGRQVVVPSIVLVRQKPGSAKGVMFITMEGETGWSTWCSGRTSSGRSGGWCCRGHDRQQWQGSARGRGGPRRDRPPGGAVGAAGQFGRQGRGPPADPRPRRRGDPPGGTRPGEGPGARPGGRCATFTYWTCGWGPASESRCPPRTSGEQLAVADRDWLALELSRAIVWS